MLVYGLFMLYVFKTDRIHTHASMLGSASRTDMVVGKNNFKLLSCWYRLDLWDS